MSNKKQRFLATVAIGHPEKKAQPGWPKGAVLTDGDLPAETQQKLLEKGLLVPYEEPKKTEVANA